MNFIYSISLLVLPSQPLSEPCAVSSHSPAWEPRPETRPEIKKFITLHVSYHVPTAQLYKSQNITTSKTSNVQQQQQRTSAGTL